jgi:hypothetical protein
MKIASAFLVRHLDVSILALVKGSKKNARALGRIYLALLNAAKPIIGMRVTPTRNQDMTARFGNICANCIAQLRLTRDRTEAFSIWLTQRPLMDSA